MWYCTTTSSNHYDNLLQVPYVRYDKSTLHSRMGKRVEKGHIWTIVQYSVWVESLPPPCRRPPLRHCVDVDGVPSMTRPGSTSHISGETEAGLTDRFWARASRHMAMR